MQAFFDKPGHGKLLVDDRVYPKGYATNVNQQYVFEVRLLLLQQQQPLSSQLCTPGVL